MHIYIIQAYKPDKLYGKWLKSCTERQMLNLFLEPKDTTYRNRVYNDSWQSLQADNGKNMEISIRCCKVSELGSFLKSIAEQCDYSKSNMYFKIIKFQMSHHKSDR